VLAAAIACSETVSVSPDANVLIVHAVLDPGVQHQIIVVQRTTGAIPAQQQVTGALVTITKPDGSVFTAVERVDTVSVGDLDEELPPVTTIYDVDTGVGGLIPGATYHLRVEVPDGRVVTGETTIPNTAPVATTPPSQTLDRKHDTVSVQWPRVPGARGYHVFVRSSKSQYNAFTDTSAALPGTLQWFDFDGNKDVFVSGYSHQVVVLAVDRNYHDYFRGGSEVSTGTPLIMHLDGGIGVFGSVVTVAKRSVYVL
jgi:hypothetical protein